MKIDVHAHFLPQALWDDAGVNIRRAGSGETLFALKRPPGPDALRRLDVRAREMDVLGVDMHVLSILPPLMIYGVEAEKAVAACRVMNDAVAEAAAAHPGRFVAVANLPMQDPEAAAAELERAVRDLGMRGAEIGTNVNQRNLSDPAFAPVWRKMEALDVPVFLHPANVWGAQDRLAGLDLVNLVGNASDSAVAVASLIFGGVVQEFPRARFYVAHGGGSCPYIRGRWEIAWKIRPEFRARAPRPPSEYLGRFYFDSLVHGIPSLAFLVDSMGPERVMLGTDFPADMQDFEPVRTIHSLPNRSNAEKEMILGGNAMQLFKIEG